jgi:uncharacterized membrane protein
MVRGCLQEKGEELRVLVRADTLGVSVAAWWWVLDQFHLLLHWIVEELLQGCWGQV